MLHLAQIEELQAHLLRVPSLINRYEAREAAFVDLTKAWLKQAEEIAAQNRLSVAAQIAGLRSSVIAAERRRSFPDQPVSRVHARRQRDATAAEALQQAAQSLSEALRAPVSQFADAERLARQLLVAAAARGLLQGIASREGSGIHGLLSAMRIDPELGPPSTALIGLIGFADAHILLDRALSSGN
jgi:hypothetical protein